MEVSKIYRHYSARWEILPFRSSTRNGSIKNEALTVTRTVVLYGLALAVLIALMKYIEYQFLAKTLSIEFYIGVVAVFFTTLGIWAGLKLTQKRVQIVSPDFKINEVELARLDISKRELDVLALMATGLSNQEIADKLFVSLNTVKTHAANLFVKLDARRRTQAIQKAKELRLIP
jgi:DNA-binding CsgD family transcriptional regulator